MILAHFLSYSWCSGILHFDEFFFFSVAVSKTFKISRFKGVLSICDPLSGFISGDFIATVVVKDRTSYFKLLNGVP